MTVNLTAGRTFALGEIGRLELRWETFNTLNHRNFGYPSATIGRSTTPAIINSLNGNNRIMQFGARYD